MQLISSGNIIIALVIALFAGIFSYKAKFLTLGGSITASIFAFLLYCCGGEKWLVPMIVFFIFSSLLSKIRKHLNPNIEKYFEKSGIRDCKQVLANGGIGVFLVVLNYFFYSDEIYLAYIGLLSVVCSDTWSTEIGTLVHIQTYNVLTLKKVEQGESGGISLLGYAGSILGSVIIALSAIYWLKCNLNQFFLIVIFTGLFGNIIDSILGALIQAQYKCSICGLITEKKVHCNKKTMIIRGKKWFDNDLVNLISGFSGCIIILVFQNLSVTK